MRSINPGNSGERLVNIMGTGGIKYLLFSPERVLTPLWLAVPVDMQWKVANDLIQYGESAKSQSQELKRCRINSRARWRDEADTLDGVVVTPTWFKGVQPKLREIAKNGWVITKPWRSRGFTGRGVRRSALLLFIRVKKPRRKFNRKMVPPSYSKLNLQDLEGGEMEYWKERFFNSSSPWEARLEAVNTNWKGSS